MRISDWSSDVCSSDLRLRIMKETILDVLLYLFEHYFYDDPDAASDRESMLNGPIFQGLTQAGFSAVEINKAFDWLDALSRQRPQSEAVRNCSQPVRVYADVELDRLDPECVGFLMFLEHNGLLDGDQRELRSEERRVGKG